MQNPTRISGKLGHFIVMVMLGCLLAQPVFAKESEKDTYDQDSIVKDASDFFGQSSEGLAKIVEKAFKEHGRPNGYIKGEEASEIGRAHV